MCLDDRPEKRAEREALTEALARTGAKGDDQTSRVGGGTQRDTVRDREKQEQRSEISGGMSRLRQIRQQQQTLLASGKLSSGGRARLRELNKEAQATVGRVRMAQRRLSTIQAAEKRGL